MRANRLKALLPDVIIENQTGFITGTFICENTRIVYDTLNYCESKNKTGLIIIIGFIVEPFQLLFIQR